MAFPDPQNPQIISIPISRVVPDRYQARLAIPPEIKSAYFSGEIDCYKAASLLLVAAEGDAGLARLVKSLRQLGQSILTERQIDPATGAWVDTDDGLLFILETGERRFWALALEAVARRLEEEPTLMVIPQPGNSRQRQVAENFVREDLCAVEMGQAIATMILESLDIFPDDGENELSYYRRALHLQRLPSGTWAEIKRLTGHSRPVLYRHLCILSLDDELLYLATLYRLPERVLRDIVTAPREDQRRMLLRVIDERQQLAEPLAGLEQGSPKATPKPARSRSGIGANRRLAGQLFSVIKSIAKQDKEEQAIAEIVSELVFLIEKPADREATVSILEGLAASAKRVSRQH
jgi:hypothetical protein